jgi:hypothetical protein
VFDASDIDVSLRQHDEVETARQFGQGLPKGFANETFPSVANDGVADFFGNGKSQPGMRQLIGSGIQNEKMVGNRTPESKDFLELSGTAETEGFGKTVFAHRCYSTEKGVKMVFAFPFQTEPDAVAAVSRHLLMPALFMVSFFNNLSTDCVHLLTNQILLLQYLKIFMFPSPFGPADGCFFLDRCSIPNAVWSAT